ncbi:MAG: hypothetical protein ABJN26_09680 [Stappiaceae bacterium]
MRNDWKSLFWISAATALTSMANPLQASEFDYLDSHANSVTATHQAGYKVQIEPSFEALGELHHRQASRDLMFRVSFAAYANEGDLILIHAETLEDASGVLDYGSLPQTMLNGLSFALQEQCVPAEAAAALETNREAMFVKEQGYQLNLPFHMTQFLVASPDGNAEVKISYGREVADCAAVSEDFKRETRRRVDEFIEVEQIE